MTKDQDTSGVNDRDRGGFLDVEAARSVVRNRKKSLNARRLILDCETKRRVVSLSDLLLSIKEFSDIVGDTRVVVVHLSDECRDGQFKDVNAPGQSKD